jgi:hypothetical protein
LAAAIVQTIDGGEVVVLDSAGYGPVFITQSVSLIAPAGVYAGISVPFPERGVAINGANINVVLHGLTINSTGGLFGVVMYAGAKLTVDGCVISNFTDGNGLLISTPATVVVTGTAFRNNSVSISASDATVNIANSQIIGSINTGILNNAISGTSANIFIVDTLVTGTGPGGNATCIENLDSSGAIGNVSATRVTVSGCLVAIANAATVSGTTTVSNSMITGNAFGFYNFGGTFNSLGTSQLSGNTTDTFGTITTIGGH